MVVFLEKENNFLENFQNFLNFHSLFVYRPNRSPSPTKTCLINEVYALTEANPNTSNRSLSPTLYQKNPPILIHLVPLKK